MLTATARHLIPAAAAVVAAVLVVAVLVVAAPWSGGSKASHPLTGSTQTDPADATHRNFAAGAIKDLSKTVGRRWS